MLARRFSPEQIAATLKADHPGQRRLQASHETIYTAIYATPRGEGSGCTRHAWHVADLEHSLQPNFHPQAAKDGRMSVPQFKAFMNEFKVFGPSARTARERRATALARLVSAPS